MGRQSGDILAAKNDLSGAMGDEAENRPQRRRLARAVAPEQRDRLAGADIERHVEQNSRPAVSRLEPGYFERAHEGASCSTPAPR